MSSIINRCNDALKGACCEYYTSDPSLVTRDNAGVFIGCADDNVLSSDCQDGSVPGRRFEFQDNLSCEPNNVNAQGTIICPDLEQGSWLEKRLENKDGNFGQDPDRYLYTCRCVNGHQSVYIGRGAWDVAKLAANPSVPLSAQVVANSWSTQSCSERTTKDCGIGDKGSFCMRYFVIDGSIRNYAQITYRFGCYASTEEEYNTILGVANANSWASKPVPNTWENKNCSERVNKCYRADACTTTEDTGTIFKTTTITDCDCEPTPNTFQALLAPFNPLPNQKPRFITTNTQKIAVTDIGILNSLNAPPTIVQIIDKDECGQAFLCNKQGTLYRGTFQVPVFRSSIKEKLFSGNQSGLQHLYSTNGKYWYWSCEPDGTTEINCGKQESGSIVVNNVTYGRVKVYNSTEEGCIHESSYHRPVDTQYPKHVFGPCKNDPYAGNPSSITWTAGNPRRCGTITVKSCYSYYYNGDRYYVYPPYWAVKRAYYPGFLYPTQQKIIYELTDPTSTEPLDTIVFQEHDCSSNP